LIETRITLNYYKYKKKKIMKTLNFELTNCNFDEFALTNEEMINVRGGEIDPTPMPSTPPIKI
jgi:hypothetical protein